MHSVFSPASPEATAVAWLGWSMIGVGGVVWLCVVVMMIHAVRRRRFDAGDPLDMAEVQSTPEQHARLERVVVGVTCATVLVLIGFLGFDFAVGHALAEHPSRAVSIDVIGHQWWWEVRYDDPDPSKIAVTANEIHVPVGVPVRLVLSAVDVIHSFWVPTLSGKKDLIPGYRTTLWFRADHPGVYRGTCAEFCGLQHANMGLVVIADLPPAFERWRATLGAPGAMPGDSLAAFGAQVFLARGCAFCHAISGTPARGTVGPDLTHVASRTTLAAGALRNDPGSLAGWISNPAAIKPGVRMPTIALGPRELLGLVRYLGGLK